MKGFFIFLCIIIVATVIGMLDNDIDRAEVKIRKKLKWYGFFLKIILAVVSLYFIFEVGGVINIIEFLK